MSKERVRFEAMICCEQDAELLWQAGTTIITHLSEKFGGATLMPIQGGWTSDGNETKAQYSRTKIEPGIKVTLCVTEDNTEAAYSLLANTISEVVERVGLSAQFIHVERFDSIALHFDIKTRRFCGAS